MIDRYDEIDWAADAIGCWALAIRALRLRRVAAGQVYWSDVIELYAYEAGPLA